MVVGQCHVRSDRPNSLISLHITCLLIAGVCVGVHLTPNELCYQFSGPCSAAWSQSFEKTKRTFKVMIGVNGV